MADLSKDSEAIKQLTADYDKSKVAYEKRHKSYIRWYRLYRSKPDEKKEKYKANVFISLTFQIINTIVPRVVKALIGDGTNFFTIKASKNNKSKDREKKAQALTDIIYVYLRDLGFYVKLAGAFLYALIFGNSYLKIFWTKVEKEVEEIEEIKDDKTGKVKREKKLVKKTVVDRPEVEVVNPQDIFVPTDAIDLQSSPYVIYRTYKSLDDLKKNPLYAKYKKVFSEIGEDLKKSSAEELRLEIGDNFEPNEKIEVLEYWTNDRVIASANGRLIRNDLNPFTHRKKPFIGIVNYPEPNTVNGVSEIESFESIQYWINDSTNIRIDNLKIVLNQMFSVIKGSLINPIQLRARPGGIVEVASHDEIKPIQVPEIKTSSYEEINQMRGLVQVITGITDYTAGGSVDNNLNDTATGIMAIIKEANERFAIKIRIWRVSVIQETLKMIVELIQQFITGEDIKYILGEQIPDFEPEDEDLQVDYEYDISGVLSDEEKVREAQATVQLLGIGSKLPTKEVEIDYDKALKKVSSLFSLQDLVVPKAKPQVMPTPSPGASIPPAEPGTQETPGATPGAGLPSPTPMPQPGATPGATPPNIPFNREQLLFIARKLGKDPREIISELVRGKNPKELVAEVVEVMAQEQSVPSGQVPPTTPGVSPAYPGGGV